MALILISFIFIIIRMYLIFLTNFITVDRKHGPRITDQISCDKCMICFDHKRTDSALVRCRMFCLGGLGLGLGLHFNI